MKKTIIAALFALVLSMAAVVPALAATPSSDAQENGGVQSDVATQINDSGVAAQAATAGGWQINKKAKSYVTKSQKKLFKKATKKLTGVNYTPIFVMSKQVVAGMNYAYFCKAKTVTAKPKTSWKVVIVYQPASGKPKVAAINNFKYKKIATLENPPSASSANGAWVNLKKAYKSKVLPKAARTAFNKAMKKYTGVDLTAMVLLSKQVVSGMNYRYLCRGVIPGYKTVNYYVVDVYQNLKGKAKVTACDPIDMEKYLAI